MNPDPDPIWFFYQKLQFAMSKLQEKLSALKTEHTALQKMKFIFYVCGSFLPSWVRIRFANPDPNTDLGTQLNPDPIRIRIRIRIHKMKGQELHPPMSDLKVIDHVPYQRIIVVARLPCCMFSSCCCHRSGPLFLQPLFRIIKSWILAFW